MKLAESENFVTLSFMFAENLITRVLRLKIIKRLKLVQVCTGLQ